MPYILHSYRNETELEASKVGYVSTFSAFAHVTDPINGKTTVQPDLAIEISL